MSARIWRAVWDIFVRDDREVCHAFFLICLLNDFPDYQKKCECLFLLTGVILLLSTDVNHHTQGPCTVGEEIVQGGCLHVFCEIPIRCDPIEQRGE